MVQEICKGNRILNDFDYFSLFFCRLQVKAVVTELDKLVSRIRTDHKIQQVIEQPLSINIFTSGNSTGGVNGKFVFSQVQPKTIQMNLLNIVKKYMKVIVLK
jgi:hypothetical protein